jgi:hypothetical protein
MPARRKSTPPGDPTPNAAPWRRQRPRLVIILAVFAFWFTCARLWPYTVDDAWITLRFARQIVDGFGFVFNPGGPPVEGFSNPATLILQIIALRLGADGMVATKLAGCVFGAIVVIGAALIARQLLRDATPRVRDMAGAAAAWSIAHSPTLATGAVSGLETSMFAAATTVLLLGVIRLADGESTAGWVCYLGGGILAAWSRPDGLAWVVGGAAGLLVLRGHTLGVRPRVVAGALVPLAAWLVLLLARWMIFGRLQPNTYYAKMAGETLSRMYSGLGYIRDWLGLGLGGVSIVMAGLAIGLLPAARRWAAGLLLGAVLGQAAVTLYTGGDWIPHLRFLAPTVGPLGALFGVALVAGAHRIFLGSDKHYGLAVSLAIIVWIALGLAEWNRVVPEVQTRVYGWKDGHAAMAEWLGRWERHRGEPLSVALEDVGLVGWAINGPIWDLAGLCDPEWAMEIYRSDRRAPYPAERLLLEVRPEVIVIVGTRRPTPEDPGITWRTNREVYEHPLFADRYVQHATFIHKDFPRDGYYLHVFLRRDVAKEAPPANPPVARATGGW